MYNAPTERILAMTGHQNGLVVTFTIVSIGDDKQLNYTTHMWNRFWKRRKSCSNKTGHDDVFCNWFPQQQQKKELE
jgi:hypothetical protein